MAQITLRLPDELLDALDAEADDRDVSRSGYIRDIFEDRHRADELEGERDRLRRQLEAVNARSDDVDALAEYVERERSLQLEERERRREEWERRRARERAPIWRRAKWAIFGRD